MTRSVAPSEPVRVKEMSPLVALEAEVVTTPETVTRRPSVASPAAPASMGAAAGGVPGPRTTSPPVASRTSVWP